MLQRAVLHRLLQRLLRADAGDGQDGALGRLHDGLVGGLHTLGQGGGKLIAVGALELLQILGKAAKQKGSDDAGIAARAAQQR